MLSAVAGCHIIDPIIRLAYSFHSSLDLATVIDCVRVLASSC